ncbi:KilA-N domain-containing protein [Pseudomonas sp. W2Jun17]|uniref:KilA-N domain-containing protein n=1 Tax=Pseudomonas sp. W2Jun17 TaxID=1553460 RepID=UPI002004FDD5|nr:KilA-N domain-containing protein [Pseudomonas sp. W2Jun17]MCK3850627.1 KilA-N domain-containing protein [Pseudomonas sp. W2Jun17]
MSAKSTQQATQLITKDWQGKTFTFREDGYFNMTKAAKEFGKDLSHFKRSPDTIDYCNELSKAAKSALLTDVSKGRYGATWAHPKLAVFFARWLDVRFSVACDMMIEDILKGAAVVTIEKPEESSHLEYMKTQTEIQQGLLEPSSCSLSHSSLKSFPVENPTDL